MKKNGQRPRRTRPRSEEIALAIANLRNTAEAIRKRAENQGLAPAAPLNKDENPEETTEAERP